MDVQEWASSLSPEDREALAGLDEAEAMAYISDHGIELPEEVLDSVVGGINFFALFYKTLMDIIR